MKSLIIISILFNNGGNVAVVDDVVKAMISQNFEVVNLTTQKMNDVSLDLGFMNENQTTDEVKEAVIAEIVVANSELYWVNNFLNSYLFLEKDEWITTGINFDRPNYGESVDYKARFIAKDTNSMFEGVMAVNVNLKNENEEGGENPVEKIDISNLDGQIGEIKLIDKNTIIENFLTLNKIDSSSSNSFDVDKITYESATVRAIDESEIFKGELEVKFSYNYKLNESWESKDTYAHAYNSTQVDFDEHEFVITPKLGVSAFVDTYKKFSFNYSGYMRCDRLGAGEDKINFENVNFSVDLTNGEVLFEQYDYTGNQNWNENKFFVKTKISEADIKISFKNVSTAYATAWNAMWSTAESQLSVSGISFIK
ncbi:hypothetical protein [Spiroplasma endosymbiont of Othius punctulatus]|uniref:hypothetical protein n=1 Tax=Spiroplasma endosymbiont of Othius punctulatus TaxID=3066289 RepID=UPI0030CD46E3